MFKDNRYPNPTVDWDLARWIAASGANSDQHVCDIADEFGITPPGKKWTPNYQLYAWKNKKRSSRRPGIPDQQTACQMIAALRVIAAHSGIALFSNDNFEIHADTFMRSRACDDAFALPDQDQLWDIFKIKPEEIKHATNPLLTILKRKVHPLPPGKLIGRADETQRILSALRERSVVVVEGVGGEGKTALTWHTAVKAWECGRFTAFDWTTDKRYVVDMYGNVQQIDKTLVSPERFLEQALESIAKQLNWTELRGRRGDDLIKGCTDRFRSGRYLIVVDNLEKSDYTDVLVSQFVDILGPYLSGEPWSSCAIIASRAPARHQDSINVSVKGLGTDDAIEYVRYLEKSWQVINPLTIEQIEELSNLTGGNPLFLQILMRQYADNSGLSEFARIRSLIDNAQHDLFSTLFESLLQNIPTDYRMDAIKLASFAAHDLGITVDQHGLHIDDLYQLWETYRLESTPHIDPNKIQQTFYFTRDALLRNRILSTDDGAYYAMHPLVRTYLTNREQQNA